MRKNELCVSFWGGLPAFREVFAQACYKSCYKMPEKRRKQIKLTRFVSHRMLLQSKSLRTSTHPFEKRPATLRILWPQGLVGFPRLAPFGCTQGKRDKLLHFPHQEFPEAEFVPRIRCSAAFSLDFRSAVRLTLTVPSARRGRP